jgi:hypothetical protein
MDCSSNAASKWLIPHWEMNNEIDSLGIQNTSKYAKEKGAVGPSKTLREFDLRVPYGNHELRINFLLLSKSGFERQNLEGVVEFRKYVDALTDGKPVVESRRLRGEGRA